MIEKLKEIGDGSYHLGYKGFFPFRLSLGWLHIDTLHDGSIIVENTTHKDHNDMLRQSWIRARYSTYEKPVFYESVRSLVFIAHNEDHERCLKRIEQCINTLYKKVAA